MSHEKRPFKALLDGRPADVADLVPLAFAGFAHFTAMQVRDRQVKGLDLHLERLRSASLRLFGAALDDDQVCAHLRSAVADGPADLSLTLTMFSRSGEFTPAGRAGDPAVLIRTGPPTAGPAGALRLAAVDHERPLAEIKHVGETTKTDYLRQAVRQGLDDAAYVDRHGRLSEATIWNLVFWEDGTIVWPKAAMLAGVTMQIVRRQLDRLGLPQREEAVTLERLATLHGAAVMNSWTPGVPVVAIASVELPRSAALMARLHEAYRREPAVRP